MSIIDYESMAKTTDVRIVKTRRMIFSALIKLLRTKPLSGISITELCQTAMLNRKTFYTHYKSVDEAFSDIEQYIIEGYIDELINRGVLSCYEFKPDKFIIVTDAIINENMEHFKIVYPYIRKGDFMRKLGAAIGNLSFQFLSERTFYSDPAVYPFSLVFMLCGLLSSYFDWIDFGRQFSIGQLAKIATAAVTTPLCSVLSPFNPESQPS